MSIDLSQFYEVFIDESFEGLETMESELLNLEPGEVESEIINNIFRAAHSIKGGSGTFGFNAIAEFTHEIETLLDQIRNGERELAANHIDLMLKSIDCLRDMLRAIQNDEPQESEDAVQLTQQFRAILANETPSESGTSDTASAVKSGETPVSTSTKVTNIFDIHFAPEPHLFKTGNEPLFIFEDLAEFGELDVVANVDGIPEIAELVSEDCYLSWNITLDTTSSIEDVQRVFEWVEDDAKIEVKLVAQFEEESDPFESINETTPAIETSTLSTSTSDTSQSEEVTQSAVVESSKPSDIEQAATPNKDFRPVAKKPKAQDKAKSDSSSIRVGTDKVDSLINMVGELVITQAMLNELGEDDQFDHSKLVALREGLAQLAHNTRDLQESVMRIRMLPISFVFSRFPRLVRDISQKLDKQVELKLIGEGTELDKTVM